MKIRTSSIRFEKQCLRVLNGLAVFELFDVGTTDCDNVVIEHRRPECFPVRKIPGTYRDIWGAMRSWMQCAIHCWIAGHAVPKHRRFIVDETTWVNSIGIVLFCCQMMRGLVKCMPWVKTVHDKIASVCVRITPHSTIRSHARSYYPDVYSVSEESCLHPVQMITLLPTNPPHFILFGFTRLGLNPGLLRPGRTPWPKDSKALQGL